MRLQMKNSNKCLSLFIFTLPILFYLSGTMAAPLQIPVPELSYDLTKLKTPVKAPEFNLPDMDEEMHSLQQYKGKVVMLNFWATWCPPCRREMPSMEAVYQTFKDQPFVVIAINEWESEEVVFPYLGQLQVFPTFPILFDQNGDISKAYKVKGLPTTFVIDKEGRIVYRAIGGRDFNHPEVVRMIRELL